MAQLLPSHWSISRIECQMSERRRSSTGLRTACTSRLAGLAIALGCGATFVRCQMTDTAALPPESADLFRAAMAEQQNQQLTAAEKDYRVLLAQAPDFLPARFDLGLVLDGEGSFQDALDQFQIVDRELATFPGSQFFTGVESFRLGKYEASEQALRLATQQSSKDLLCWFWLARAEFALSHETEGKAALDEALRIDPDDPSSLYLRALTYISDQDLPRSQELLTRLVEKYPQVPEFHRSLGSVYYMQAQLDKAQGEYTSQLAIDPHDPQALSMLGVILLDRGQAAAALPYLKQGLDANPRISFLQWKIGQALSALGRPEEAIPHLKEAIALDPQDATAHYLLWKAFTGLHRPQEAEPELEAFRKLEAEQQNRIPASSLPDAMFPAKGTPP
jgi:tetratricopeptide (TPR) repeat protein